MSFSSSCKREVEIEDTAVLWHDVSEREAWEEILQEVSIGWCRLAYELSDFGGSRADAVSACAERLRRLSDEKSSWQRWVLFCADRAWQPDSRVIRHRGFWRRVGLPAGLREESILFEAHETSAAGIRYFSALNLVGSEIPAAAVLAHNMRNAILLLFKNDSQILNESEGRRLFHALYSQGGATGPYTRTLPNWPALLRWAVRRQATVATAHGYYDDPLIGIDLVGETSELVHSSVFDSWDIK